MNIRHLNLTNDMEQILEIENASFFEPWEEEDFLEFFTAEEAQGRVISVKGSVIGYILYLKFGKDIQITALAVRSDARRRGYGTILIAQVLRSLSVICDCAHALVADDNLEAQLFLRSIGFCCTGTDEDCPELLPFRKLHSPSVQELDWICDNLIYPKQQA